MSFLAPGLRELARVTRRQIVRGRLVLERRKLARLEAALGLLGWQQADYDENTQPYVNRLMDYEREQARLGNESASLAQKIGELEKQRAAHLQEHEKAAAEALRSQLPAAQSEKELEVEIAAQRKQARELEARLPVLQRELDEAEAKYRALVDRESFSSEHTEELMELRRVLLAIPKEKSEWEGKLALTNEGLRRLNELLKHLRDANREFEKADAALASEIAEQQRAKRRVEKESDVVEKAKTDPYREIGRALADHEIAPLNQPEALRAVLGQRERISAGEAELADSAAASAQENRPAVRTFFVFLGSCVALVLFFAILAIFTQ